MSDEWKLPDDIRHGPTFSTLAAAPTNWGMAACRVDDLRALGDGDGEIIAVLDTGIESSHPEFAGRILDARSFVPGESAADTNGHGTHVASTAAGGSRTVGVANRAKLLVGKCLSNSGSGQSDWIQAAFDWALAAKATCVTISIGGPGFLEGMEPWFVVAAQRGVLVTVAMGNERQGGGVVRIDSSAILVASVTSTGVYSPFSNPGSSPEVIDSTAPGSDIIGAWPGGRYNSISGTSMATPFVGGCNALLQSARGKQGMARLTTADVKRLYRTRNLDAGAPGPDRDFGPGLLDCGAMARALVPHPVVQ
jgi:subtilisin